MPEVFFVLCARSWSSRPGLRRIVTSLLATFALTAGFGAVATIATPIAAFAATSSMEAQFIADMNAARQANGLSPYAVAGDLTSVARGHSANMASRQSLYHNPSLTTEVQNWQAVGENVGEGPTVQDIHTAFMRSPDHRANILDHDFTQVGVGVSVDSNGIIWVTEDFRQPMSGSTAPASQQSAPSHSTAGHSSTPASTTTTSAPAAAAAAPATVTRPTPTRSPRERLLHRLHQLRQHSAHGTGDRVAQAFDYVRSLSRLAG